MLGIDLLVVSGKEPHSAGLPFASIAYQTSPAF